MFVRFRAGVLLLVLACLFPCRHVAAGDWPQILGPNRNGIAVDERIAENWAAGKPKKIWERKVGSGFAGAIVVESQVILFHREQANDLLTAFDRETGTPNWSTKFPSSFQPQIVDDDGPRATPVVDTGSVFAFSAEGVLLCVDLKSGDKKWERKTHKDFGATGGYFGAGSSPLVDGKRVIVNVGGDKKRAGVVAFDVESGETLWTAVDDQASYSSPVITTIDGIRHLLCITRLNLVSIDPETGKERFRTPFGARGPTVNGAIPVISGQHLFLTASYGIGAEFVRVEANEFDVIRKDEILSSQYTTPILDRGSLFGIDGRQDGGPISLKCFDLNTGKSSWSTPWDEYATLIAADGKLLVMRTDGVLTLVKISADKYVKLGSASLLTGKTRALPALSRGRFYVRNEKTLACFDLSQ